MVRESALARSWLAALLLVTALVVGRCGTGGLPVAPDPEVAANPTTAATPVLTRIGALRGPTTMALAGLLAAAGPSLANGPALSELEYVIEVAATPEQVTSALATARLDAALLPINLAATLYQRTDGDVRLAAVTALGVLYAVTADPTVSDLNDLTGRRVLAIGRGTTPQLVLDYLLASVPEVTVEYRAEAGEVLALLAQDPSAVAVLPEPFVSAALLADEAGPLRVAIDLNQAWEAASGVPLVTAGLAVRVEFVDAHPGLLEELLTDLAASVAWVNANPEAAAPLIVANGVVADPTIATAAIPRANLVVLRRERARAAVDAVLLVVAASNPELIGGRLPDVGFYIG